MQARRGRCVLLLPVLLLGGAGPSPEGGGVRDGADLLARIRAVGDGGSVAVPARLRALLGLELRPDATGRMLVQEPGRAPAYLATEGIGASLRTLPAGRGREPGQGSAMLELRLDTARVCVRLDEVRAAFDGRGEMLLSFPTHRLPEEYLAVPLRSAPPLDVWFTPDNAGCVRSVAFNENCFADYGHGCANAVPSPRR